MIIKLLFCTDGDSEEDQSSVVRREKKGIRANPMIQKVKKNKKNTTVYVIIPMNNIIR